jgi:ribosomal protein S12 methylthiotransferase
LRFVEEAQLDWCGFFTFSPEEGTHAMTQPDHVDQSLMNERIAELREMQDAITASRRDDLIGETVNVLVDEKGIGRTHREAPSIDGVVHVSDDLEVGKFYDVTIADAMGPDLLAAGANTDAFDGEE